MTISEDAKQQAKAALTDLMETLCESLGITSPIGESKDDDWDTPLSNDPLFLLGAGRLQLGLTHDSDDNLTLHPTIINDSGNPVSVGDFSFNRRLPSGMPTQTITVIEGVLRSLLA